MENIIVAEGLRKEYDGFALEDVSFRVPGGAIMGLIGENGAGKSTTINGTPGPSPCWGWMIWRERRRSSRMWE